MDLKNFNTYLFFGLLMLVTIGTFFIFQPFFMAIILAAILATLFQGMFEFFQKITRQNKSLSSLFSSLAILLLIVIPIVLIVMLIGSEIMSAATLAGRADFYQNSVEPLILKIESNPLYKLPIINQALSREAFTQYSSQIGQVLLGIVKNTYQGLANTFFLVFVMFFSLYYFFIDGKDIVRKIMYISPFKSSQEKVLINDFVSISKATIKGVLIIGVVQGAIGAVVFAIAGVPSPIVWGIAMMFFSLIPLFGSGIVWIPTAIVLLLIGHIWQGIFIFAIGFGIISVIDNFVRPRIIGKKSQMHPLLVFFATLGGLILFGFVGFIIGPVIVALFVSLWDICGIEFGARLKRQSK